MPGPNDDRIRERAYELWDGQGRPADRSADHWLQAEREVGAEPVDGPVAPGDGTAGPDETAETLGDDSEPSIVTLARPAPDSVESDG